MRRARACGQLAPSGKTQVTVVPRPTAESSFTVPPCSSTKERTSDRPSPVPRWREPSEWVSNQSNTLSFTSAGMPRPAVGDREHHGVLEPLGRQRNRLARRRKAYGIGQEVEQRLPDPPLVGDEAADIGGEP